MASDRRDQAVRAAVEHALLTEVHPVVALLDITALRTAVAAVTDSTAMPATVRAVYELAEEINAAAGRRQIDTVDIVGGLPVDFASDGRPRRSTRTRGCSPPRCRGCSTSGTAW